MANNKLTTCLWFDKAKPAKQPILCVGLPDNEGGAPPRGSVRFSAARGEELR